MATAWYKTPYFPPAEQDSRHLGRAREALSRGDEMARRFMELAGESSLAINETLAFDEDTLEVVTLGLVGEPMGNPLQFAFTGKSRARALAAAQQSDRRSGFSRVSPNPSLAQSWIASGRRRSGKSSPSGRCCQRPIGGASRRILVSCSTWPQPTPAE